RHESPGGRAGEPRVLRLAGSRRVRPRDRLRVDVGLAAIGVGARLLRRRADREVRLERALAFSESAPGERDPRVVVAEDARVLLVPGRVARDLAELWAVARERGLHEGDAVLRGELPADALECAARAPVLGAGPTEHAPALALDEDPALVAGTRPDGSARRVERAHVPLAVPRAFLDRFEHPVAGRIEPRRVGAASEVPVQSCELAASVEEEAGDHHRLRTRALDVACGLERLVGIGREAVE